MGMCVTLAGLAVSSPAGVSDADIALDRRLRQRRGQVAQLADIAADGDAAVLDDCDAGGIIAAIFQTPQAIQNHLRGVVRADVTDDATHGNLQIRE